MSAATAPSPAPSSPEARPAAAVPAAAGASLWSDAWRRLRRNRVAVAGAIVLAMLVLSCAVIPEVFGLDPEKTDTARHGLAPGAGHLFGTDNLGRDYLARVLVGGRTSLMVGLVATLVSVLIGTLWGAVAGYYGGLVDDVMMRVVDFLYAIPYMFLVILIMLMFQDSRRGEALPVFAALGAVQWLTMARIVRGQVIGLRNQEFVLAARTMGASDARILLRHILPNCMGPIIVYSTLTVPAVILLESALSYLGLGIKLSWGILVADGVAIVNPIQSDWWLLLFPSLFLAATLLSLNFLGDGLRDALDPRTRR